MQSLFDQLWELDKEKSYARLTITPIREGDKSYYLWEENIWIYPYPNPFGYGGQWGQGPAWNEDEVKRLIKGFRYSVREWQKRGLEKIDIIRQPEMPKVEYKNQKRQEWLERDIKAGKKADTKTAQLSLM